MAAMSATTKLGDGLYVGGLMSYCDPQRIRGFGLYLNVAWELAEYRDDPEGFDIVHVRLHDNDDVASQLSEIERAVSMVTVTRQRGHSVLITCAEGRNRSCLVAAEYLIRSGADPDAVIARIQHLRRHALSNPAFISWLRRDRVRT